MAAPSTGGTPNPLIQKVTALIAWVMARKPVRVFLHYGNLRGPILASGLAFQGLFAVFAGLWVAFSIAGIVISGNIGLRDAIINTLNNAIPGLIATGSGDAGAIDAKTLLSAGVFGVTGAIALLGLLVTALGWLASARDSVRTIFELPTPTVNFLLLKVRDLGLGVGLGAVLIISAVLSVAGTSATGWLLGMVGVNSKTVIATVVSRVVTLGVMFALDTVVLAAIYRVLADVQIPGKRLRAGALIGAAGLGLLKVLSSTLLGGASSNPLIASFAVIAGLLIFFNFACQVILLGASWIAVGVEDAGVVLDPRAAQIRLENARRLVEADTPEPDPEPNVIGRLWGWRHRGARR